MNNKTLEVPGKNPEDDNNFGESRETIRRRTNKYLYISIRIDLGSIYMIKLP